MENESAWIFCYHTHWSIIYIFPVSLCVCVCVCACVRACVCEGEFSTDLTLQESTHTPGQKHIHSVQTPVVYLSL